MVTALVIGATGAVGKHVLTTLLASETYTSIHEVGRKVTQGVTSSKLVQHPDFDFNALLTPDASTGSAASLLANVKADVMFITLGTTRADAGSAEAFIKIDQDYVVAAAQYAKPKDRILYLSSAGANHSSSFLYPRSKGETEKRLAQLKTPTALFFEPGYLAYPNRQKSRILESIFGFVIERLVMPFSKYTALGIPCPTLAKSMVIASQMSIDDLDKTKFARPYSGPAEGCDVRVINNSSAIHISEL